MLTALWNWMTGRYNKTTLDILSEFHKMVFALEDHVSTLEDTISKKTYEKVKLDNEITDHKSDKEHAEHVLDKFHDLVLPPTTTIQTPNA